MAELEGARLLVFLAGGRRYACSIDAVREIIPARPATRLPGAPSAVIGLINLRGRLVTVVDLAAQLDARDANAPRPGGGSIVLLESGSRMIGVLVDEVRDVRTAAAGATDPLQREESMPAVLQALARFADGTAVVIDPGALVAHVLS